MKIAYVSPVGVLGGAEQCLLNIMASIRQTDPTIDQYLIVSGDGPLLMRAQAVGVQSVLVEMPPSMAELGESILHRQKKLTASVGLATRAATAFPQTGSYVWRLRQALRRFRPDVIHSNGLKSHLLTSLAKPWRSRLVWHLHDFLGARPAMGRALRWAARRADAAIAISDAVARDAQHVLPKMPITTVFNAIDLNRFSPGESDGARLDALAGLPPAQAGTLRVGLVATYAKWKGQETFLEAAARVRSHSPVRFYIVGGPIYRTRGSQFSEQELRDHAAALGIADRVGFIPFQLDTPSIYRDLDIVVHASTQPEPFGLTIVEAMACGKPVIVSQAGGAAELFTHGSDALGWPPGNATALAEAIGQLVENQDLRKRLSAAALQTARSRFCHQRLGHQMLAVYRPLMGG